MHRGEVRLQIQLSQQRRHLPCQMAFLLDLWTLLVHFTKNKEANTGLKQRNKSKITYTPWAASMLDCISRELEDRVFLQVFTHCKPIRSLHLRSRDLHTGFQPSDLRASKMAGMPTQFDVLPALEEWHINLEVGSQVYHLLKGFKQLLKATLWPDSTSTSHMGGFRNGFEKTLPQVVIAPCFFKKLFPPQSK